MRESKSWQNEHLSQQSAGHDFDLQKQNFLDACAARYDAMKKAAKEGLNFAELEQIAFKSAQIVGTRLLESCLSSHPNADPEGQYICSRCKGKGRIQERQQGRTLRTILGKAWYQRPYVVCDRCQISWVPLDEALGIPPMGSSVSHKQKVCHAAVVGRSFDDAQELLQEQAGISISAKHACSIAEEEGRRIVRWRAQKVKAFQGDRLLPPLADEVALMVISCDGGRVQTRQPESTQRWKEDKIGVVYDAIVQPAEDASADEYKGAKAVTKSYVATMESWEQAGWMLRVEAEQRGYCKAKEKVFVADGAEDIRELQKLQFPDATFILDWPHAVEHLMNCAKAVCGEGSPESKCWYKRQKQKLWDGKAKQIIAELQKLSKRLGEPTRGESDCSPRVVLHRNATSYFPNNKDAINYPLFRAKGWPIGSGVAEGAVKQFGLRVKGSEKFWNVSGAEEMLALCALYHSEDGRWERHWRSRAQPYQKNEPQ